MKGVGSVQIHVGIYCRIRLVCCNLRMEGGKFINTLISLSSDPVNIKLPYTAKQFTLASCRVNT